MSLSARLDKVAARHRELSALIADPAAPASEAYAALTKEYADLTPIAQAIEDLHRAERERDDLRTLLADPDTDEDMRELAESECAALDDAIREFETRLRRLLLPKDKADEKNAILEVRAGTGGEEAALFAADLFRMYQRYAESRGWRLELMSLSETGIGGFKEVIGSVIGRGVFARLKYESGVHRVQRVPETEAGGRIHTSAATVAVLPEAEDIDVQINEGDLRIDVYRSSGPGGQSVNTTDSAVRITHLPTGIVVTQQDEKSQHKNRAKAMKILRARIYEAERAQAASERAATRKSQVGSGDRSERIRTYNFPQGRVTDHRINLTLYKLERVMGGELDELIDALDEDDQAERLAEVE
ncbi:MAG: peptide chain release factor 1 [Rhodospirillales bacterium]|nr:peptide chain release factor 1 [Rhodospirillales bacterium]